MYELNWMPGFRSFSAAYASAVFLIACGNLTAQGPTSSAGASGSPRAVQLPTSMGGPLGAVASQQSAAPSGSSTLNSSLQVSGAETGSIPSARHISTLSLADAVKLGLRYNLGPISANNNQRAARAERTQALSALLPQLSASASETVTQVNLAAYGFKFNVPPSFGVSIPTIVGPFSYFQAQGALSQSVYDLVSRRNLQSSRALERASALSARDEREVVVLAAGGTYLQALALGADIASQQAQVDNARAIYQQAETRKEAGTNSKIDVMRSLVQLQTEEQRLTSLQADYRKQKIALARIVGIPLGDDFQLSDELAPQQITVPDAATTVAEALKTRQDLRAVEAQVDAAQRALAAAKAERLPSLSVNGDYGTLGQSITSNHGVFAVTGSLNVPIWQGGRVRGDIAQAQAALDQRQAELADARGRVEEQVRDALVELQTAAGQVKVAETNRNYANETLAEARDRFGAGVATTVEVVQAQQQVAGAEADYISSLFSLNLAKLSLARARGSAENEMSDLLKGARP